MALIQGGFTSSFSSGTLDIQNNHIFTTAIDRDVYFTTNSSDLEEGLYCKYGSLLGKYINGEWVDVSVLIEGASGDSAYQVAVDDGFVGTESDWLESLKGEDGSTDISVDNLETRTTALEVDTHTHVNKSILDTVTAAFTTAYETKLANITEIFRGEFLNSVDRDASILSPQSGWQCKQLDTNTVWIYAVDGWHDTGLTSTGDMVASTYDPQGIGGDVFNRAAHTGSQEIETITNLQTTLDGLVEKEGGKGLSQEDFTTDLSNTLESLDASNPNPSSYWGTLENEPSSSVKTKIFRVTFPSDDSDFSVAHSLPSEAEVIGLQCGFRYSGASVDDRQYMPPNFTDSDDFHYQIYCNTSSVTIRQISASNLYGRTGSLIITYITEV